MGTTLFYRLSQDYLIIAVIRAAVGTDALFYLGSY